MQADTQEYSGTERLMAMLRLTCLNSEWGVTCIEVGRQTGRLAVSQPYRRIPRLKVSSDGRCLGWHL